MKAENIRVEYLKDPIGLFTTNPRFSWTCTEGIRQTAYRIRCSRKEIEIWDSGKVCAAAMTHIPYAGAVLNSRDEINYSVQLWDEKDAEGEPVTGSFEMGILKEEDWTAKWITGDYKPAAKRRYPVDCFQKKFSVKGSVRKARLYASALGVYDAWVDGRRIEDFLLAPGSTDYRKRVQYQTYDVTEYLSDCAAEHTLELRLADGWYRGSSAAYGVTNVYGRQTSVIAQLELELEDGNLVKIGTDQTWSWSNDGPIRFADLKDGEIYDASLRPSYRGKARLSSDKNKKTPVGADNVYVTEHECFSASLIKDQGSIKVLDFSQNIAGSLKLRLKGRKGKVIRIYAAELLDEKGYVDSSPIQETRPKEGWTNIKLLSKLMTGSFKGEVDVTPHQEILFTCSGDWDDYKTSFTVFGFRYVQIEGPVEIDLAETKSIALYSDMEQTGEFSCSDERVNQFVANTRWSMKGNFLDVPTDCPTRERLGWTGDAQIFFDTGAYFMDTAAFFAKWMRDMEDAQYGNGLLPAVLPYAGAEMMYKATGQSVGWADAVYLIPYRYYKRFGDSRVLIEHWEMMKKYGDYLLKNLGYSDRKKAKSSPYNDAIYEKGVHLGEWLEPVEFRDEVYGAQAKHPEEGTAYLYYAMNTLSEIAGIVGDEERKARYHVTAEKAKQAYIALFCQEKQLDTKRQAKLVRPLALGLLDGDADRKDKAQAALRKAAEDFDYRVGTGFLSTAFLLGSLTEGGSADTAYKLLLNEKNPGWLYEVLNGSTTVWENWEGKDANGKGSFNHYSPGSACQWLFDTVCGIRVSGERCFTIAPVPGEELTYAEASYRSIYGLVKSCWEHKDGKTIYHISIPANCKAALAFAGMDPVEVEAGNYKYELS